MHSRVDEIETERLLLRPLNAADAPAMLDIFGRVEVARTRLDNHASQAVCRRLGRQKLGPRTDWYDTEVMAFRATVD